MRFEKQDEKTWLVYGDNPLTKKEQLLGKIHKVEKGYTTSNYRNLGKSKVYKTLNAAKVAARRW